MVLQNRNSLLQVQPHFILLTLNIHPSCHTSPHSPLPLPSPHSLEPWTVQTCKKNRTKTKHDQNRQHTCLVSAPSLSHHALTHHLAVLGSTVAIQAPMLATKMCIGVKTGSMHSW